MIVAAHTEPASLARSQFTWVLAAGLLGFAVSGIFSSILQLPRGWFVAAYLVVVTPFLVAYLRWDRTDLTAAVRDRWPWGLLGAVILGAFMVQRMLLEVPSPRPSGLDLIFALFWLGLVYAVLDALLLIVLPVHAVRRALADRERNGGWAGVLLVGIVAVAASLFVTAAYHLGYAEFRSASLVAPLIGSGLTSIGYLLTRSPLTPVLTHLALHIASVWHGIDTTVTLPPHY
jgi:hypothetical protein